MNQAVVHPVDEMLPSGKLFALGMQHVLVMYAGAVAVPLIVGRALKLSPDQVALLISADRFCCGIATLIQSSYANLENLGIAMFVLVCILAITKYAKEGARAVAPAISVGKCAIRDKKRPLARLPCFW